MKIRTIALLALVLCIAGATCISFGEDSDAEGETAKVALIRNGEISKTFDSLNEAASWVWYSGGTLQLLDDITDMASQTFTYGTANVTIDLNGHNIELAKNEYIYLSSGTLNIQGPGTISEKDEDYTFSPIYVQASSKYYNTNLVIGEDVTVEGMFPIALYNKNSDVCNINVDFYGTAISGSDASGNEGAGIYVNGNITNTTYHPRINIHPGAIIDGGDGEGIYAAGYADWTIDGATISGVTAMEIRAGTLTATDSTFIGTASTTTVNKNGNGSTTTGAGIAVAQHTTNLAISVVVDSCNVSAATPFNEANPQGNTPYENISMAINGGTFTVTGNGEKAVNSSSDLKGFVYGGQFSTTVDASYIASGKAISKINDMYCVATPVETSPSGTVDSTTDSVVTDVGTSSQVQVNLPSAKVSISGDASLNSIMVSAESKTFSEAPDAVASYEITIVSSTSYVADITVSANIPYGQQAIVFYIDDAGQLIPVEVVSYTYDSVTFRTNHTTPFVVMTESSSFIPGNGGDDDEYPFPPWNGNNQGTTTTSSDTSDDDTKIIAAAAAVIVVMLAAVALMMSRKN